jgi:cell division protein FtsX
MNVNTVTLQIRHYFIQVKDIKHVKTARKDAEDVEELKELLPLLQLLHIEVLVLHPQQLEFFLSHYRIVRE